MNTTEVLELNYFFSFFGCKRHRAVPTSLKIAIRLNKVVQKTNTGWTFRICLDMNIGTNIHTIVHRKYSLDLVFYRYMYILTSTISLATNFWKYNPISLLRHSLFYIRNRLKNRCVPFSASNVMPETWKTVNKRPITKYQGYK